MEGVIIVAILGKKLPCRISRHEASKKRFDHSVNGGVSFFFNLDSEFLVIIEIESVS